jgi:hypothetical protein
VPKVQAQISSFPEDDFASGRLIPDHPAQIKEGKVDIEHLEMTSLYSVISLPFGYYCQWKETSRTDSRIIPRKERIWQPRKALLAISHELAL